MPQVPFYKPSIGEPEIAEVVNCLRSGWLTTGPRVQRFEAEFARYQRRCQAVALNSCTAALHLALEAVGVKAGDTVVVPTLTFAATAEVVRYFDATPLLVDCRVSDLNLDVEDASARIEAAKARGANLTAIIPVHYGGQIGDVQGVLALARRFNLRIVEDAAHCCPAYYRLAPGSPWKTVGSDSDVSCFSFYANKAITTGEGGMACTDSRELADRMRIMSLHGISRDAWKRYSAEGSWYYEIVAPGYKYNLTDIAASIGLHQLRKADRLLEHRARRAQLYGAFLGDVDELLLPSEMSDRIHSWHLYSVRLRRRFQRGQLDRARVISELKRAGIGASVHWMPLLLHPYYRRTFGYRPADFPRASAVYSELFSLPLYPDLSTGDVERVCRALKDIIARSRLKVPGARLAHAAAAHPAVAG